MKVIVMATETHDFMIAGEIQVFDHITSIVEYENRIDLVRNKNYSTMVNKQFNRIVSVEYGL